MASYQPLTLHNGEQGMLVTAEEVTNQIFASKSAEVNRKLLKDVLNSLFTFVGLLDNSGILVDANKAPLEASGLTLDDVKGKYFWDCDWWAYSDECKGKIKQAVADVKKGSEVRFDIDVKVLSGFITVDFMMKGLFTNEKLTHIIPSAIDISGRKQIENKLRLSQSRFQMVTNRTVDGLIVFDRNGIIQFSNKRFEEFVGKTLFGAESSIYDFFNQKKLSLKLDALIDDLDQYDINTVISKVDNNMYRDIYSLNERIHFVEVSLSPLPDINDTYFLATISDVTALYQSNQALEKALDEKTVLLNEVHHRVKNNLQIMSSLLSLQIHAKETNNTTKEALQNSQRRIQSMALIHQLLYEKEDYNFTDAQQFTSRLISLLKESMVNLREINVVKDFNAERIILNVNQLVPYGFLLTELITNAFKHAFVGSAILRPEVVITLATDNDNLILTVSDNGQGIAHTDNTTNTLGKDLINIFARQLNASITTTTQAGVSHNCVFKLER